MIELIKSNYDEQDGISYVKIKTNIGNFEGYAFLHDDDKENASKYFGCRIAESRATIDYLKKKIYILNLELDELNNIISDMPYDLKGYKYLKRRKEAKENTKKVYQRDIEYIKEYIKTSINERDKFFERRASK